MDRTLVVLKPDAVQRALLGRILTRFEQKGLKIVGLKMLRVSRERAERMYHVHREKDFYEPLVRFITSGPVVAAVVEGQDVVNVVRGMLGPTCGAEAPAGTIRGDFGMSTRSNLVHASDSAESAGQEMGLFFTPAELVDYELSLGLWVYVEAGRPET